MTQRYVKVVPTIEDIAKIPVVVEDAEGINGVNIQFLLNAINVKAFGAVGDGVTDDTEAIQSALDLGGYVIIPSGTYMVNAVTKLNLYSNTVIELQKGAILKAIANSATSYAILQATNISNFIICGEGEIQGERDDHTGSTGEWGNGINISGCNNFIIKDIKISDCWGDGIYIYGNETNNQSTDGQIINVTATENRRNNMSIVAGKDIKIIGGKYSYANGTSPEAGIDIEPNESDGYRCENIFIDNVWCYNNDGNGIVAAHSLIVDLTIQNCAIHDNGINGILTEVSGQLIVKNNKSYSNAQNGLKLSGDFDVNMALINGNYCYDNNYCGIELRKAVDCLISSNICYLNNYEGIKLHSTGNNYNMLSENICHSNSQAGNSSYANIYIASGSDYNILSSNILKKGSETNKPSYGLNSASSNTYVLGNNVIDGGNTRGLTNTSGMKVKNNYGQITENIGSATTSSGSVSVLHGLWAAPTHVIATGTVAGEIVTVSTLATTTFLITVKKADGSAGTNQTVYWKAERVDP